MRTNHCESGCGIPLNYELSDIFKNETKCCQACTGKIGPHTDKCNDRSIDLTIDKVVLLRGAIEINFKKFHVTVAYNKSNIGIPRGKYNELKTLLNSLSGKDELVQVTEMWGKNSAKLNPSTNLHKFAENLYKQIIKITDLTDDQLEFARQNTLHIDIKGDVNTFNKLKTGSLENWTIAHQLK